MACDQSAYRSLSWWDRHEVRQAVGRGRPVDDLRLAAAAVDRARSVQRSTHPRRVELSWLLYLAFNVAYLVIWSILLSWYVALGLLALPIVFAVRAKRDQKRVRERAREAEEANRWLLENYELLDDRTRARLRSPRFSVLKRLLT